MGCCHVSHFPPICCGSIGINFDCTAAPRYEMQKRMILLPDFFNKLILDSYKRLELSLKLQNDDSAFVCQVYFVPLFFFFFFLARMCKVRVYSSVAVQSLLKIFILTLSQSLFVCVTGKMGPRISEDVVYIFVVSKRGLHLITILSQCSANVVFILRAACLNCLQPPIAALCLCQLQFSSTRDLTMNVNV